VGCCGAQAPQDTNSSSRDSNHRMMADLDGCLDGQCLKDFLGHQCRGSLFSAPGMTNGWWTNDGCWRMWLDLMELWWSSVDISHHNCGVPVAISGAVVEQPGGLRHVGAHHQISIPGPLDSLGWKSGTWQNLHPFQHRITMDNTDLCWLEMGL
jgi:hypothetical protein